MLHLLDLYQNILICIVRDWLSLKSIVALDSSLNKAHRNAFQSLLGQCSNHIFAVDNLLPISDKLLAWCKAKQLEINREVTLSFRTNTLKLTDGLQGDKFALLECKLDAIANVLNANAQAVELTVISYDRTISTLPPLKRHENLRSLHLHHCAVTELEVNSFIVACQNLTCLSADLFQPSSQFFAVLTVWGGQINSLELGHICDYDKFWLSVYTLHRSTKYKTIKFPPFDDVSLTRFLWFKGGPALTTLDLMSVHLNLGESRVTDKSIQLVPRLCPNLIFLNLSECYDVTDASLVPVLQRLPRLTHVNLMNLPEITAACLQTISQHCAELRVIVLGGIPDNLKINAEDLTSLLINCHHLQDMSLIDLKLQNHVLTPVMPYWSNLTVIDVGGNVSLTNAVFVSIFQTSTKLRAMYMNGCRQANGKCINALLAHCQCLEIINIGMCSKLVTKEVISKLLRGCPSLTLLDLYGSLLPRNVLPTICKFGGGLMRLGLINCKGVTAKDLMCLASSLPRLRVLGTNERSLVKLDYSKMKKVNGKLQFAWLLQSSAWQRLT